MIPSQQKRLLRSQWKKYRALLDSSYARMEIQITAYLQKMAAMETSLIGGPAYRTEKEALLNFIRNEKASLETALNGPTSKVMETMQREQVKWFNQHFKGDPSLIASFNVGFDSAAGRIISNAELDIGKRIGKWVNFYDKKLQSNLRAALSEAEKLIRLGELEGLPVEAIVRDLKHNVIGLDKYQRNKGLAAQVRTVVNTNCGAMNSDIMHDFGEREKRIVGVVAQRGPGPCPGDICGSVLGVPENGLARFLYPNVPHGPFHPNSYYAIVGYIFEGDEKQIAQARRHTNKVGRRKMTSAFIQSRSAGRKYQEAQRRVTERKPVARKPAKSLIDAKTIELNEKRMNETYREGGISGLADELAKSVDGTAHHAVYTNSSYITLPNGKQIRLSDHTKWGSMSPTQIMPRNYYKARNPSNLTDILRRAAVSAKNDLKTYKQFNDFLEKSGKTLAELAGF